MEYVSLVNTTLAALTIGAQGLVVLILVAYATRNTIPLSRTFLNVLQRYLFPVTLGITLTGTLVSLFYSEIAGYEPCVLCWYQRIALYPHVVLLSMAWYKKDFGIRPYIMALSGIGALIGLYQYLLSFNVVPALPCAAAGGVSCTQQFVLEFGYITIPLMSLTAFVLILAIWAIPRERRK